MRVSNDEKQRSRARILAAAGRRLRENGIAGASLSEVMHDAGMTHGGFYKHFPDKDALVAAAIADAFDRFVQPLATAGDGASIERFLALYLSRTHRDSPGEGCPIAALAAEVGRGEGAARQAMTDGIEAMIGQLQRRWHGTPSARDAAIRDLAAMVGAIVMARAVADPLSDEILGALQPARSGD